MNNINILILEDEALHAAKLEILLEEMDYRVLPIVDNTAEALRVFQATRPDLVILDIRLRGEADGISFAQQLRELNEGDLPIIFLTSLNDSSTFERAKATKPHAFLLKPVDRFSLQHAIELALQNAFSDQENRTVKALESALSNGRHLFVKQQKKLIKVAIEDITVVEVDGKYCQLFTIDQKFLVRTSLKELLKKLPPELYLQTHRNYLVNVNTIAEIDLEEMLIQTATRDVPISKNFKSILMDRLDLLK